MEPLTVAIIVGAVLFSLVKRIGKLVSSQSGVVISRAQAAQAAYTEQMQAAQAAAQPTPPPAPPPAPPPQPMMINVTATGLPQPPVAARRPGPPPRPAPAPATIVVAPAAHAVAGTRAFFHEAFRDPAHARRAIILAEVLSPPPALR